MWTLYNTALLPLRLAAELWGAWPRRDPARRREWDERRARGLPRLTAGGLWIHGASVGEARIVGGLAREIRRRRPALGLAVSAFTATGRHALPAPPDVDAAFFVPLDFRGFARRAADAVRPAALALVETELWPNLLRETQSAGAATLVLNGRLSARRMGRYRRLRSLLRPLLERLDRVGAQSARDAERFAELGARTSRIVVTGNIKYDLPSPDLSVEAWERRLAVAHGAPIVVAGSTGAGEEALILTAFEAVLRDHGDVRLILAPRYPDRINEVERLVRGRGLDVRRLSDPDPPAGGGWRVLLVDSLGQLAGLYRLASAAFVGGSLVPVGGHNLLEPAAVGVPVLFGPHTDNVVEPAAALEAAGGGERVDDAAGLATAISRLLGDPERRRRMGACAESVVQANRGALDRSVSLVLDALASRAAGARP